MSTKRNASPGKGSWGKLRIARILVALFVLVTLFLAFTDFRQVIPDAWGHRLAEIQFIPALKATLAGVIWPSLIILLVLIIGTLLFGRVYCSFICPLGIFQDVVSRIGRLFKGKKKSQRYSAPLNKTRYIILAVIAVAFAAGFFIKSSWVDLVAWIDPYSQFGRMVNMFFNPALAEVNNSLVGSTDALYPVLVEWPREAGLLLIPVILLLLAVVVMALLRGRLYCNSICPVGSLLGLLSKFAAFKVTFDKGACVKCAKCMKACKSECIDLRRSEIDYSRCVNCFDCTAVCNEKGLKYRFSWKRDKAAAVPEQKPAPKKDKSQEVMEMLPTANRRAFMGVSLLGVWATLSGCTERKPRTELEGRSRSVSKAISPPGSQSVSRFLDYCTACHLCLDACPTKTLRPAYMEYGAKGFLKPHLTFEEGFCSFECTACADVCPVGAILPIELDLKKKTRIAEARFKHMECIVALNKNSCGACSEHCPTQALAMVPMREVVQQPHWRNDYCARCGECFRACRFGAITQIPDPESPDLLIPVFDRDKCVGCQKCKSVCEAGALEWKPADYDLTIPKLDKTLCIGCGACESACPVNAVVVGGVPVHQIARVVVEEKVENPNEGVDFPF